MNGHGHDAEPKAALDAAGRRILREAVGLSRLVADNGLDANYETMMHLRDKLDELDKKIKVRMRSGT